MLLLDTHTFLWFVNDPAGLPARVNETIEMSDNVYISIVSFWEMAIKNSLGKLDLPATISQMMKDCERLEFSILPIKSGHLERLRTLPWYHRDPFDRLLVCQAQEEKLTLVSADEKMMQYNVQILWK